MIGLARRVGERCLDVIGFQIREVTQNLVLGHTLSEHRENIRHANAQPPDARSPTALVRFHRDAFQEARVAIIAMAVWLSQQDLHAAGVGSRTTAGVEADLKIRLY